MFEFECSPFISDEGQHFQFADLPFKLFAFARQRLGTGRRRLLHLQGFAPGPVGVCHLPHQIAQSGVAVEQGALGIGAQQ